LWVKIRCRVFLFPNFFLTNPSAYEPKAVKDALFVIFVRLKCNRGSRWSVHASCTCWNAYCWFSPHSLHNNYISLSFIYRITYRVTYASFYLEQCHNTKLFLTCIDVSIHQTMISRAIFNLYSLTQNFFLSCDQIVKVRKRDKGHTADHSQQMSSELITCYIINEECVICKIWRINVKLCRKYGIYRSARFKYWNAF